MINTIEAIGLLLCIMGGCAWLYLQYKTDSK